MRALVRNAALAGDAPNNASTVRSLSRMTFKLPQSARAWAENICSVFALSTCCAANTGSAQAAITRRASTFFITFPFEKKLLHRRGKSTGNWRRLESVMRAGGGRRALVSGRLSTLAAALGPQRAFVAVERANEYFETRQPCAARQSGELCVQLRRHADADLRVIAYSLSVHS